VSGALVTPYLGGGFGPPTPRHHVAVTPVTLSPGGWLSAVPRHLVPATSFPRHPVSRGWQGHPVAPSLGFPPHLCHLVRRGGRCPPGPQSLQTQAWRRGDKATASLSPSLGSGAPSQDREEPNFGVWGGPPKSPEDLVIHANPLGEEKFIKTPLVKR